MDRFLICQIMASHFTNVRAIIFFPDICKQKDSL